MTDDASGRFIKGEPADVDSDDDRVPGSEDLPADIPEDDLAADEEPGPGAGVARPHDDPDAPAGGPPFSGEVAL